MKETIELFIPGRLCIFGEHSDWASEYRVDNKNIEKGYALVATVNQGIYAQVKKCDKLKLFFKNRNINFEISLKQLSEDKINDEFLSCFIETTKYIVNNYKVSGIDINIVDMDLPIGVGLSSSSAICVLVVKAFNELYNLNLDLKCIMNIAYLSEKNAGFKCGKMDHVVALKRRIIRIIFDSDMEIMDIKTKKKLYFVLCKIKEKSTKQILKRLHESYPYIRNKSDKLVQDTFGKYNKEIVLKAIKYIESGNIEELGKLMTISQECFNTNIVSALGDEFREDNLHNIINNKDIKKLILGAKGVGSHGDGAIQFLVENKEKQQKLIEILHTLNYETYELDI